MLMQKCKYKFQLWYFSPSKYRMTNFGMIDIPGRLSAFTIVKIILKKFRFDTTLAQELLEKEKVQGCTQNIGLFGVFLSKLDL